MQKCKEEARRNDGTTTWHYVQFPWRNGCSRGLTGSHGYATSSYWPLKQLTSWNAQDSHETIHARVSSVVIAGAGHSITVLSDTRWKIRPLSFQIVIRAKKHSCVILVQVHLGFTNSKMGMSIWGRSTVKIPTDKTAVFGMSFQMHLITVV